jgi:hypothetical protein
MQSTILAGASHFGSIPTVFHTRTKLSNKLGWSRGPIEA